ncbi:MAG: glutamate--cysteine ligase [Burkholderiales bacterium]|nr:glutamate--cysteine ligase [Burkholderiales bacterium]
MSVLDSRLRALTPEVLAGIRRGIEKESLRVRPDGRLALTPHPAALGSALTHAHITTDFSESQLELITGVHTDAAACLEELTQIHQVVYRSIGDELLWCSSMPCGLPAEHEIPIGQYGSSNVGRAKTVYRTGLSHRYGRRMQTISGIHYNFSLPDAAWPLLKRNDGHRGGAKDHRNDGYFGLIRNFRRRSWLLLYLYGASPAVCESFVAGRPHRLQPLVPGTLFLPYGTSLRMGPLGYQSDVQSALSVSYNSLESYAGSLHGALTRPYPPYEAIGIRDAGEYRQLATSLLQIENEFYGTIRPKRTIRPGERPLRALAERGVEYVEIRLMDLDPFLPVGIVAGTMRFLDMFLLHCVLSDSPPDAPEEIAVLNQNLRAVAERGRDPELRLDRAGEDVQMGEWARALLGELAPIAEALDAARGGSGHRAALAAADAAVRDPSLLPSAQVLRAMAEHHGNSYVKFALAQSLAHRHHCGRLVLAPEVEARFARLAEASLAEQRAIESADDVPFERYRQQYVSQELLSRALQRAQR